MLKPVSILALDEPSAALAAAVQQRVARALSLDDLVQSRAVAADTDLAQTIQLIQAQRQRPDSPLRTRDDISSRELVLLILTAAGPARATLLDTAARIRRLYETRRLAAYFTIEILCLLPETSGAPKGEDYANAYGLLKALSAEEPKAFDEVWLLDATNASRVKFGTLDAAGDVYAGAIAGALMFEPEMSGALPGLHPRGMPPAFSSFGYASLVFPRDAALQRVEPRFAAELISGALLRTAAGERSPASLRAKQFVVGDGFAVPLARIGIDAGQSLFKRFQPRTLVTENTRSVEEVIAAVRHELKTYRDTTHLQNLDTLAKQGDQTANEHASLLSQTTDETLDHDDYASAIRLLDALLDPLPDLRADAAPAPRNLATEIQTATAALDARLGFMPNTASSDAARKRIRELDDLLQDQKLVADTLSSMSAADQLAEMEQEKESLTRQLPETVFAEENENNTTRNAARDAEATRLAGETEAREQQLRDLFAQRPRAEQALREALEMRRTWLWRKTIQALLGGAALYAIPFVFGVLLPPGIVPITLAAASGLAIFIVVTIFHYFRRIAPLVREARDALVRLGEQIDTADKAKNAAHNDELQFEYDVMHRRTTLQVLRRAREAAKTTLDALRTRLGEIEQLVNRDAPTAIATAGLTVSIVDHQDIDVWYDRTGDDRKPFLRDFPITRSQSRHLSIDELRDRITAYAATAFESLRSLTLAAAAAALVPEDRLAQRLRRFAETSAPFIELRDDDLPARQAMQRDTTIWIDSADAIWLAQIGRRLPDAHPKPASDALHVHALSRVLHFPGYVLGQIDFYRAEYEAATNREFADVADLIPLSASVRAAYEQVLLARAVGVVEIREDGQLISANGALGDSHLAAAERLAAGEDLRTYLDAALAPRLSITRDVERDLRQLIQSASLSAFDRDLVGSILKRYGVV